MLNAGYARIVLVVAIGVFLAQGWYLAGAQVGYNEELVGHAAPPATEIVVEDHVARAVNICDGHSWIAFSRGGDPHLVLCAGGLAWPILVNSYIGGVLYWPLQVLRPLHHGNLIALRRTALPIGALALLVLFLLVERLGGALCATLTVVVAAVFPAVVIMHSVLTFFELVPALLIACAALVVVQRADPSLPPTARRAAAAGGLLGLAVFASIKAVFIGAPLLAFALFESPVLRRTSARAWFAAGLAAMLMILPMAIAAVADPYSGFGHQVSYRLAAVASKLNPRAFAGEIVNALISAADLGIYMARADGSDGNLWPATLVLPAIALAYSTVAFVRALWRLPHDRVAAACGAVQLFYLVFVWLAYTQEGGNYLAICYAQSISAACVIAAVGRMVAKRGGNPMVGIALATAITIAPLVANTYRRGDPRNLAISINLEAERELGEHLQRTPGGPVIVTSTNLVGIPDAVSGLPEVRLNDALGPAMGECAEQPDNHDCGRDVIVAVINAFRQARFLIPLRTVHYDKGWEHRISDAIASAADAVGAQVREEAHFGTRQGVPVLALLVVDRGSESNGSHGREAQQPGANEKVSGGQLGQPRADLTAAERAAFDAGQQLFTQRLPAVGPFYNGQSCGECHAIPTVGGSGDLEHVEYIAANPPAPDGRPHGEIVVYRQHALPGWTAPTPPANVRRRIAPPLYGLGLIERIPDATIRAACGRGHAAGAKGQGTLPENSVARFGVKAFLGNIPDFTGSMLDSESNVSNPLEGEGSNDGDGFADPEVDLKFIETLAAFVRGLAPPGRNGNDAAGERAFRSFGCAACHVPDMPPATDVFSDFCVHRMGDVLADGIPDHDTKGDEFRTTPLQGLRFRKLYLHDGRATTLESAITAHGGEAEWAVRAYQGATGDQRAALLRFLDTL